MRLTGSVKPSKRFKLTRHFALNSLAFIATAALLMNWIFRDHNREIMRTSAETHNATLTQFLSNTLWPRHDVFLEDASRYDDEEIRRHPQTEAIAAEIQLIASNTTIVKVKIYDLDGRVVFSTDRKQIGTRQPTNAGFLSARDGTPVSELTHRDTFDSFEGTIVDRDLLSSYLPIRVTGKVKAVFEIYSDVTELVHEMEATGRKVLLYVALPSLAVYLLLFFSVRTADRLIARQYEDLEEANDLLESRVMERTEQLREVNRELTANVEQLRGAEERLRLAASVFENSGEGIAITDAEQRIVAVNRAFTEITGYAESDVIGRMPNILKSGRQEPDFYRQMWDSIERDGGWRGEIWNKRRNGEIYPEWLSVSAVRGQGDRVSHYVGVFSDISEVRASQAKLEHMAHHDPLTGLPNRTLLLDRLEQARRASARDPHYNAIIFIDLDQFKALNDTKGHGHGDLLLQLIASRLSEHLCQGDTVSRHGGDEFVILLTTQERERTAALVAIGSKCDKLLGLFAQPCELPGMIYQITASMGISCFNDLTGSTDDLLRQADLAMYRSKEAGGNRYTFFDPVMESAVIEHIRLSADLRQAIEEGQFELHYQPQVDCAGSIVGAEALIRWNRPGCGMVSPLEFIPHAEKTGLIDAIGTWVLEDACERLARWATLPAMSELTIAVNVSAPQFHKEDFTATVLGILDRTGADPHRLKLELTESVFVEDADRMVARMHELKATGISFSLDDFGTGYSSLAYLSRMPLDQIKIDRTFVADMENDERHVSICAATISLAHNLKLKVVAEGVENSAQRYMLGTVHKCDSLQGYLYGKPMTASAFETVCAPKGTGRTV